MDILLALQILRNLRHKCDFNIWNSFSSIVLICDFKLKTQDFLLSFSLNSLNSHKIDSVSKHTQKIPEKQHICLIHLNENSFVLNNLDMRSFFSHINRKYLPPFLALHFHFLNRVSKEQKFHFNKVQFITQFY